MVVFANDPLKINLSNCKAKSSHHYCDNYELEKVWLGWLVTRGSVWLNSHRKLLWILPAHKLKCDGTLQPTDLYDGHNLAVVLYPRPTLIQLHWGTPVKLFRPNGNRYKSVNFIESFDLRHPMPDAFAPLRMQLRLRHLGFYHFTQHPGKYWERLCEMAYMICM